MLAECRPGGWQPCGRHLESGYKHGQVRFHLSDDNAARFVVKIDMVVYNFPRYKVSREEVEIS